MKVLLIFIFQAKIFLILILIFWVEWGRAQDNPDVFDDNFYFLIEKQAFATSCTYDTLWVRCRFGTCCLFWQGDTLTQEYTYNKASTFATSLGVFGFTNHFLLTLHYGDGCPVFYRILAFDDNNMYYLTDDFGNCCDVESVKISFPEIEFSFPDMAEIGRKKITYVFDKDKQKLFEKK